MASSPGRLHDLFNDQLKIYEKVVSLDLMDHRSVYGLLRETLLASTPPGFVFLDVACGSAGSSSRALAGLPIGRYVGVDASKASLSLAAEHLAVLPGPRDLRCADFEPALRHWDEPVDAVWIGMSLHHLEKARKADLMRRVFDILPHHGLFLIWEPTLLDGENREEWLSRFRAKRQEWISLSDHEFEAFLTHMEASDFPESSDEWLAMGRSAGFADCAEIYVMRNRMGRVFRYWHG